MSSTSPTSASDSIVLEDLLDNGQGVGRVGGMVAFVTGGLPGERVRIAVDARKKNYVSAHAVEIEAASPDRIPSVCPVFPRCGGCQTLHLRYEAQLKWKERLVREALARLGGFKDPRVEPAVASPGAPAGYRNKVSLVVESGGRRAQLGFFAARSHRLVPIEHCPAVIERLDAAIRGFVALAGDSPEIFRDTQHLVVRASATTTDLVASFNGSRPAKSLPAAVSRIRERIPGLTGITTSWDPRSANAVFGSRLATVWGASSLRERVLDAELTFGIASFFQTNTSVLELLTARLVEALAGAGRVVDLYCGVGTFGVLLGKRGVPSTGVEHQESAVDDAAANAAANGVTCAAFETASVSDALAGARGRSLLHGAVAAIVDPPRKGCEPDVIAALGSLGSPRIYYVSCNPATLARDAKGLATAGYRLSTVTPFDMFPHTGHVEALAEFER